MHMFILLTHHRKLGADVQHIQSHLHVQEAVYIRAKKQICAKKKRTCSLHLLEFALFSWTEPEFHRSIPRFQLF